MLVFDCENFWFISEFELCYYKDGKVITIPDSPPLVKLEGYRFRYENKMVLYGLDIDNKLWVVDVTDFTKEGKVNFLQLCENCYCMRFNGSSLYILVSDKGIIKLKSVYGDKVDDCDNAKYINNPIKSLKEYFGTLYAVDEEGKLWDFIGNSSNNFWYHSDRNWNMSNKVLVPITVEEIYKGEYKIIDRCITYEDGKIFGSTCYRSSIHHEGKMLDDYGNEPLYVGHVKCIFSFKRRKEKISLIMLNETNNVLLIDRCVVGRRNITDLAPNKLRVLNIGEPVKRIYHSRDILLAAGKSGQIYDFTTGKIKLLDIILGTASHNIKSATKI